MTKRENEKKIIIRKKDGNASTVKYRNAKKDSSAIGKCRDQDIVAEYIPKPRIKKGGSGK